MLLSEKGTILVLYVAWNTSVALCELFMMVILLILSFIIEINDNIADVILLIRKVIFSGEKLSIFEINT